MTGYVCTNCNYKFSSDKAEVLKKCPYCSKNSVKAEASASDLLAEATKLVEKDRA